MRAEVIGLATRVKARGYRTAIVTNNAREFRERWTTSVPLAEICHEVVDSSEVGVRKPDARIYELALEGLSDREVEIWEVMPLAEAWDLALELGSEDGWRCRRAGGVLGAAAMLMPTSYPLRTSPVNRTTTFPSPHVGQRPRSARAQLRRRSFPVSMRVL